MRLLKSKLRLISTHHARFKLAIRTLHPLPKHRNRAFHNLLNRLSNRRAETRKIGIGFESQNGHKPAKAANMSLLKASSDQHPTMRDSNWQFALYIP